MEWLKELLLKAEVEEGVVDSILKEAEEVKMIPKHRFDEVNNAKKQLEDDLKARDVQLEEISNKATGNDDLKQQIEELQTLNKKTAEEYEKQLEATKFGYALNTALKDNKVRNVTAVEALLDIDAIKLDNDKIIGLEEQITKLKETDSYLFESETATTTGSVGNFGLKGNSSSEVTKEDFKAMNYKERLELYNSDKELYEQLKD